MFSFISIFPDRKPREPGVLHFVEVWDALWLELADLGDGRDGVFGGVAVLRLARVARLDDLDENGKRFCKGLRKQNSPIIVLN